MKPKTTTIQVLVTTREVLRDLAKKGEIVDDVIQRLIDDHHELGVHKNQ